MHKEKHYRKNIRKQQKKKKIINVIIEVSLRMRENNPEYKQHICIKKYIYIHTHSEPQKKSEVVQELADRMKQNEVREAMKNTKGS